MKLASVLLFGCCIKTGIAGPMGGNESQCRAPLGALCGLGLVCHQVGPPHSRECPPAPAMEPHRLAYSAERGFCFVGRRSGVALHHDASA